VSSVELVASVASDLDVVNAARVSYDTRHDVLEDGDDKLIAYLINNKHGTPFEHTFFKWRIEAPIFVFREWHRHRIGWSYNEMSGRYVELPERFYAPSHTEIRAQTGKPGHYQHESLHAQNNHTADMAEGIIRSQSEAAFTAYRRMLLLGVAKEQARTVLPVGTYSQMIATCNARSLMAFLELRTHPRAQQEIRELAVEMLAIFTREMPITALAFELNGRIAP
jgi:thymidylate synthase (FAD)